MTVRPLTDDLTEAGRRVLQNIAEQHCHVVHVAADRDGPSFSYTVGLWHHFRQPEVIVFGLEPELADDLFDALVERCVAGERFATDEKHEGLLVGYAVRFLALAQSAAAPYFGAATWAYQGDDYRCLQLVWPDKNRRWPWEEGVRRIFVERQPIIGRRPS